MYEPSLTVCLSSVCDSLGNRHILSAWAQHQNSFALSFIYREEKYILKWGLKISKCAISQLGFYTISLCLLKFPSQKICIFKKN